MNFVVRWNSEMLSGQKEASERRYFMVGPPERTWFIADQEDAGDNVYVCDLRQNAPRSDGFGGSTLHFTLVDGSVIAAKGPWHSNSNACFKDTGIDTRDKHRTWGVVSRSRKQVGYDTIMEDVLYKDESIFGVVGHFDRIERIAQEFADKLGCDITFHRQSAGGSSTGGVSCERS